MTNTIACLGDSQTQMSPYYAVHADQMWVERLAHMLRGAGADVQARSFGIGGQSTGEMVQRADILSLWETPAVAVLYGGVNDTESSNAQASATPSASGGSITAIAGSLWYAVGYVVNFTSGAIMATALTAVQLTAGSTNSIVFAASTSNTTITSVGVYISPTGYASSAAAIAAGNRALRLQATYTTGTGGTVTTLSGVSAIMPTAGTQAMSAAFCKMMKYRVLGLGAGLASQNWFLGQANLPANAKPGQRAVVLDDTSTTGGLAAVLSTQHATITGDYSASPQQSVWERRTPQAAEAGWGRVAIASTAAFSGACSKILLVSTNYLNWTSGGDNAGSSSLYAANAAIRALTQAAATAEGAVYVDLFTFQAGLITSGETTQGGNSWHAITNNQHHNTYGHDIVARAIYAQIISSGWLSALTD